MNIDKIPDRPGYYVLLINVREDTVIETRGGKIFYIPRGTYLYVGSAKGPGGLRARIKRHLRRHGKKLFWHIDYLLNTGKADIERIYYRVVEGEDVDYETIISRKLAKELDYIPGFGCSDKRGDQSHLFKCVNKLEKCLEIINKVFTDYISLGN